MPHPGASKTPPGRRAEGVTQAAVQRAKVVTPLLVNLDSSNAFELTKVVALRAIAAVLLAAGAVRVADAWEVRRAHGGDGPLLAVAWARVRASPLPGAAAMLLGVTLVSTLTSVAPWISLWGSYDRVQGIFTFLCYVLVFLSIASVVRTREQVDRLLATLVLASVPVSLYAVLQRKYLDPIAWATDTAGRVTSTLGNANFLAGFLIMCVPITLARLVTALAGAPRTAVPAPWPLACAIALGVQLLALAYTRSWGAWLGLATGLLLFGLLAHLAIPAAPSRRGRGLALAGAGALLLSVLLVLTLPAASYLGQLVRVKGDSGTVRVVIWDAAARLVGRDDPPWSSPGGPDRLAPLRPVIGYGPETLRLAYRPFQPAALARLDASAIDRSHNEIWDRLVETGILGVAAYTGLLLAMLACGFGQLGLLPTRRHARWVDALALGGAGLAVVAARVLDGSWRLAGPAWAAGLLLGTLLYLLAVAPRGGAPIEESDPGIRLTRIAVTSAIVAHFVEVQLGFSVTSTRLLLWTCAGLLVVTGRARPGLGGEPPSRRALGYGLVGSLLLVTMVWDFSHSFLRAWALPGAAWLLLATWILGASAGVDDRRARALAVYGGVTAGSLGVYWGLSRLAPAIVAWPVARLASYYTFLLVALLGLGVALSRADTASRPIGRRPWWVLVPVLGAAVVLAGVQLRPALADMYYRQGVAIHRLGDVEPAVRLYEETVRLAPWTDVYAAALGRAVLDQHDRQAASGGCLGDRAGDLDRLLSRAESALDRARALNPVHADYTVELGRLYRTRALRATAARDRQEALSRALALYEEAGRVSPNDPRVYIEWGRSLALAGRLPEARGRYRHALALDPGRADATRALSDLDRLGAGPTPGTGCAEGAPG